MHILVQDSPISIVDLRKGHANQRASIGHHGSLLRICKYYEFLHHVIS